MTCISNHCEAVIKGVHDDAPSLTTLPGELLQIVATHLDKTAALSFARVSRECTAPAEGSIWKHLDLCMPKHFGKLVLIQPYAKSYLDEQYVEWAQTERGRVATRRAIALRERLRTISLRTNERRVGMVRTARVAAAPRTHHTMLNILDLTSPNLGQLCLETVGEDILERDHPDINIPFKTSGIRFPSLTHLYIADEAVESPLYIYNLCLAAPNLITLHIGHHVSFMRPSPIANAQFDNKFALPNIRQIHLTFPEIEDEVAYVRTALNLLSIIVRSPGLKQLSWDLLPTVAQLSEAISAVSRVALRQLEDLYWETRLDGVNGALSTIDKPFPALRRLNLYPNDWQSVFEFTAVLPQLEILFFLTFTELADVLHVHPTVQSMTPAFSRYLIACPRLHAIHEIFGRVPEDSRCVSPDIDTTGLQMFVEMDKVEKAGRYTHTVRSFRHGESELLHARLALKYLEKSDSPQPEAGYDPDEDQDVLSYTARDGSLRLKVFDELDAPIYQDFTNLDGRIVPLSVIEQMREVQGATEEQWRGRGIVVGDAAWQVLLDWKEIADEAVNHPLVDIDE